MSVSSDSPVAGRAMVTALWPAVLPVCDSPWRNVKAAVLWLLCGWARLAWVRVAMRIVCALFLVTNVYYLVPRG